MKMIDQKDKNRLDKLKALAVILAENIDAVYDQKNLPLLVKQYRETIKEIEELEGTENDGDEITQIIQKRNIDGKPGAVRKNRSAL